MSGAAHRPLTLVQANIRHIDFSEKKIPPSHGLKRANETTHSIRVLLGGTRSFTRVTISQLDKLAGRCPRLLGV